jgi:hypothetical protein
MKLLIREHVEERTLTKSSGQLASDLGEIETGLSQAKSGSARGRNSQGSVLGVLGVPSLASRDVSVVTSKLSRQVAARVTDGSNSNSRGEACVTDGAARSVPLVVGQRRRHEPHNFESCMQRVSIATVKF